MSKIRWLQISDLHFGDNTTSSKNCREGLLQYIESLHNKKIEIDYVFITGDIIFAKGITQKLRNQRHQIYKEAIEYIKKIYVLLWPGADEKFITNRIFIVPGNHDLVRSKARQNTIKGLLDEYRNNENGAIDSSYIEDTISAMREYFTFYNRFASKSVVGKAKDLVHYVVETEKINVLHINTCLASSADGDDGNLVIGLELLNNALEKIKNKKPIIAIAHHNFDCLNKMDQRKMEILLKNKNVCLYLCGHAHERESTLVFRANQTKVLNSFTCGTLMPVEQDIKKNDSIFYQGEFDLNMSAGTVYAHKWTFLEGWHEDKSFGLSQDINDNYRSFNARYDYSYKPLGAQDDNMIISKIVTHQSADRNIAFLNLNEKAGKSLSIYGIGLSSISKHTELLDRILDSNGTVRFCMVAPQIFKESICRQVEDVELMARKCELDAINFCIYANHIDEYIRKEYYDDIKKSMERIKDFKKQRQGKPGLFQVRMIESFIPLSINIINEETENEHRSTPESEVESSLHVELVLAIDEIYNKCKCQISNGLI